MNKLILASSSPRRIEILTKAGFIFDTKPCSKEENADKSLSSEQTVEFLAEQKAEDVFKRFGGVVLGADTVVSYNGQILGKPKDKHDAVRMLKLLSGKTHFVFTGYCIIADGVFILNHDKTEVVFNNLSDKLINDYVESGLCKGKAGSYGIQDGYNLVKEYNGSYNNVVGLPIERIEKTLKELLK